jgi:serine/threonine-protein kinase RsbW
MHKKTFSANLDNLHSMLGFIQAYSQKKNIDPFVLNKIILAAEEALVNIIHYGYPEKNGNIEIVCEEPGCKPGIRILIKDQGVPFNPVEKTPSGKGCDVEDLKLGGYGIYLFVGIMDRVEYRRRDEGNILSLIKYL